MKQQQVLVFLSCMIIVSHCEEATCGSAEKPKKIQGTVQGHLKSTMRSLWQEELAKEVNAFIEGKFEQLDVLINQLQRQVQVLKNPAFLSLLFILLYLCASIHETIYFQKIFFSAKGYGAGMTDSNRVITFNLIEANEGEGLNKESGRFRAPVGGTYEFVFSGETNDVTSQTSINVYKDGSAHSSCINEKEGTLANDFKCYWMLKVSSGEEVYLKVETGKLRFLRFTGQLRQLLKADG